MKPEAARRAAFLLKAREALKDELDPTENYKPEDLAAWQKGSHPWPLGITPPEKKRKLYTAMAKDEDDGTLHDVAILDVAIIIKGLRVMLVEVETELRSLGMELD